MNNTKQELLQQIININNQEMDKLNIQLGKIDDTIDIKQKELKDTKEKRKKLNDTIIKLRTENKTLSNTVELPSKVTTKISKTDIIKKTNEFFGNTKDFKNEPNVLGEYWLVAIAISFKSRKCYRGSHNTRFSNFLEHKEYIIFGKFCGQINNVIATNNSTNSDKISFFTEIRNDICTQIKRYKTPYRLNLITTPGFNTQWCSKKGIKGMIFLVNYIDKLIGKLNHNC